MGYYSYNYNELYHHGIKGQKWGVRRFQNPDGTLTAAGRRKYLDKNGQLKSKYQWQRNDVNNLINETKKYRDESRKKEKKWSEKAKKPDAVDNMSDAELKKRILQEFGKEGLSSGWLEEYGYDASIEGFKKYLKDNKSEYYDDPSHTAEYWKKNADRAQKVIDHLSGKKLYEISKEDIKDASFLAKHPSWTDAQITRIALRNDFY